jgi:hypothetical protein
MWKLYYLSTEKLFVPDIFDMVMQALWVLDVGMIHRRLGALMGVGVNPVWFIAVLAPLVGGYAWCVMRCRAVAPQLMQFAALFWALAILLSVQQYYPLTPSRHVLYGYVFLLLPLAAFADKLPVWLLLAIGGVLAFVQIGFTPQRHTEWDYAVTQTSVQQLESLCQGGGLGSVLTQDEPIVVNRFASLYFDHAIDGNRNFYHEESPIRQRRLGQCMSVTDPLPYRWRYDRGSQLAAMLRQTVQHYPAAHRIWFMALNVYGGDLMPFHACLRTRGLINADHTVGDGLTLYAVSRKTVAELLATASSPESCFRTIVLGR